MIVNMKDIVPFILKETCILLVLLFIAYVCYFTYLHGQYFLLLINLISFFANLVAMFYSIHKHINMWKRDKANA